MGTMGAIDNTDLNKITGRPVIWGATYISGNTKKEYYLSPTDPKGYKERKFTSLDKSKIAEFWLEGPFKVGFSTLTGIFFVEDRNGNKATFFINLDKEPLTRPSQDIIHYKDAVSCYNQLTGDSLCYDVGYRCGYKWKDGDKSCQIEANILGMRALRFNLKIVWDKDVEATLNVNGALHRINLHKGQAVNIPINIAN